LRARPVIDWQHPSVRDRARELAGAEGAVK
jgi:hypothetical protein